MLAIVIPYYNIQFFETTLKSLAEQTDQRFCVYIGNDASPNNPENIIKKYNKTISISYKAFSTNVGQHSLTNHWNRCIDLIQNEKWIQILGDDDVLASNCVAQFYQYLDEININRSNLVRFASQKIDSGGIVQSEKYTHPKLEVSTDSFFKVFKKESRSSLSEHIFKKEVYEKNGFQDYPLAWFSDTMAWLDFSEDKPVYTINEATVLVRFSDLSISGKKDNMKLKYKAAYLFYRQLIQRHFGKLSKNQKEELVEEYKNYVQVTRSYTWDNWRIIVWNALKKLDLKTIKKMTKKTYIANKKQG